MQTTNEQTIRRSYDAFAKLDAATKAKGADV